MTSQRGNHTPLRFLVPAITLTALAYFAFHAINGKYGLIGGAKIEGQLHALQLELAELGQYRAQLEQEVLLLRPSSLDADMVDEQVRAGLNWLRRDELILITDN